VLEEPAMTATSAALEAHRNNFTRYCQLLATELTEIERTYLHRRIAETRAAIERLEIPIDLGSETSAFPEMEAAA
jgi:hypothetical protein